MRRKKTLVFAGQLKLDIFWPSKPREDRASVLSLHAGGFAKGSREDIEQLEIAVNLLREGFTVITMDYPLSLKDYDYAEVKRAVFRGKLGEVCYSAALTASKACAEAIRFLCEQAEELDLNPKRMILLGSGAGAMTVLQTEFYRSVGVGTVNRTLGVGWRPVAVVAYAGALTCKGRYVDYGRTPAPTMLVYGDQDKIMPTHRKYLPLGHNLFGPVRLQHEIRAAGGVCWRVAVNGGEHEVSAAFRETKSLFMRFVEQALAGGEMQSKIVQIAGLKVPVSGWSGKTTLDLLKETETT